MSKKNKIRMTGVGFSILTVALFGVLSISLEGVAPLQAPDHVARAVLLESNGKILAAGRYFNGKTLEMELRRFEKDGSPDQSFGDKGSLYIKVGRKDDIAQGMAQEPNGKTWIVGRSHNKKNFDFSVTRINPDGSLDKDFGKMGTTLSSFGEGDDVARSIALQSDGKGIVVGYTKKNQHYEMAAVRYLSNGKLDPSFGKEGRAEIDFGASDSGAVSTLLLKDGKILIGGCFFNGQAWDLALVKLTQDGKLDPNFGNRGKVIAPMGGTNDQVHLAIQPDGKFITAGNTVIGERFGFSLMRFEESGKLDKSFGIDGVAQTAIGTGDAQPFSIALQKDGKIVTAGSSFIQNNRRFTLARFLPNGKIDSSFGSQGIMSPSLGSEHSVAKAVTLDSEGSIIAAGCAYRDKSFDFALARVNAQGTLEWHFPVAK